MRQIAKQLNGYHSIINRKLKRNTQQTYQAELADKDACRIEHVISEESFNKMR